MRSNAPESSLLSARITYASRNLWSGFLAGIGFIAFVDEVVFHQLLHWHHFYDKSTSAVGLVSDGLFHALNWFATIAGMFMVSDLRRRNAIWPKRWWGGMLLGVGGFQLYDGTIQHKWMRIHQIRYVDNIFVYDVVWNVSAAVILIIGIMLIAQTGRLAKRETERDG